MKKKLVCLAFTFIMLLSMAALAGCSAKVEEPETKEAEEQLSPEELKILAATRSMDKRAVEIIDESGYFLMYNKDEGILGFYDMKADSGILPGPMAHVKLGAAPQNQDGATTYISELLQPGIYRVAMVGNLAVVTTVLENGDVSFIARFPIPDKLWEDDLRVAFSDITCKMVVYEPSTEPQPEVTRDVVIVYDK